MANNCEGELFFIFHRDYLNKYVNICLTMQLSIPDTYANIELDEDLQQILEEICKFSVFSTVPSESNNNNNVFLSF